MNTVLAMVYFQIIAMMGICSNLIQVNITSVFFPAFLAFLLSVTNV